MLPERFTLGSSLEGIPLPNEEHTKPSPTRHSR